jgi:hypothetical protein
MPADEKQFSDPGPAAQVPYGPLQGKPNLLPQFSNLGKNRPFGPGEYVDSGGSWESEMTYTLPMGDKWSVVPGLWVMDGVPHHVTEDQAIELAQGSGLNWPSFASQEEADKFAAERESKWQTTPFGRSDLQQPLWTRRWPPPQ